MNIDEEAEEAEALAVWARAEARAAEARAAEEWAAWAEAEAERAHRHLVMTDHCIPYVAGPAALEERFREYERTSLETLKALKMLGANPVIEGGT